VGEDIPSFDTNYIDILGRLSRPQVVILFAFFMGIGLLSFLRVLLLEYLPSCLSRMCPILIRCVKRAPRVAKGLPNYFDGKSFFRLFFIYI
jgi:hypothetical protein